MNVVSWYYGLGTNVCLFPSSCIFNHKNLYYIRNITTLVPVLKYTFVMKAQTTMLARILVLWVSLFSVEILCAQEAKDYTAISGTVRDGRSGKNMEYVNISVPGTSIGTVTNADGYFIIKIADSIHANRLEISHLGYMSREIFLSGEKTGNLEISLHPNANTLPEVTITGIDALKLVQRAAEKISANNSPKPTILTGFYRETVKKRRKYIDVTEAVVHVYKTAYTENTDRDRLQVFKGRQLMSSRKGDTLIIKLQGGPHIANYLDMVKNKEFIIDEQSLKDYKFRMQGSIMLDERPHYVVGFEPQLVQPYPLFYGKLYIDEQTLAFTQGEFSYNMKDRNKITNAVLKKKPVGLRFKPEEVTYFVNYKFEGGRSYLNYMRSEIRFKCDWKRKLFSTGYAVVSEMVITDKQFEGVSPIPHKQSFREKGILSDDVGSFYDEDFWEGYNIIAPTESLESAVGKLKKENTRQQ